MTQGNQRPVSRLWGIVIGSGLALSPIHNQVITSWATNSKGETLFFLPAFGYLLLIMGTGLFLLYHWDRVKAVGWGDRRVVGCLLFIVLTISASGAAYTGLQDRFAPMCMGIALLGVYLIARVIGRGLVTPLTVGAIVASLGVIAHQLAFPGQVTGGFVFESNYDIVVGYILLGTLVCHGRLQWLLVGLASIALLFTGSPEAIFAGVMVGLVITIREWRSRRYFSILCGLVGVLVVWLGLGHGLELYRYPTDIITQESVVTPNNEAGERQAIGYRLDVIRDELSNLRPLGTGYSVTDFNDRVLEDGRLTRIVHNVPLVIVQQLGYPGVLAGVAWLFISVWCLRRTRWRYVWVAVLALSVFDHYLWTQLGHWWWVLVGISTVSQPGNDLIFTEDVRDIAQRRAERILKVYRATHD